MPTPAFGYLRQSKTKVGSESKAIQREAIEKAAPLLGVEIVRWFEEPDSTSGFKNRGRSRPEFPRMLDALRRGEARAIVVYKSERLSRGGGPGWAPVYDAAEEAGLDVDRFVATPSGFMNEFEISIRAAMDREESKKLSDRMTDVRRREAQAGKPRGGGLRPFGYEADLMTLRPEEADLIREAADRVLRGESAWGIARDWNSRGLTTSTGGHWGSQTVKRILKSGRIAGLREHRGAVLGEAAWPAILDRATWEEVRRLVDSNSKVRRTTAGRKPKSDLVGFIFCGRCGSRLVTRTRSTGRREYACQSPESSGRADSCGSLVIHADPVEADLLDLVVSMATDPEYRATLIAATDVPEDEGAHSIGAEIEDVGKRKARLLDLYEDGDLSKEEYRARRSALDDRLEALQDALAARSGRAVLSSLPDSEEALRRAWDVNGPEWRRLIVDALFERITVAPGRAPRPADRVAYKLRA